MENSTAFSQKKLTLRDDSPLAPDFDKPNYWNWGLFIGFGQEIESGEFWVKCPNCPFKDGIGSNFTFGGLYQYNFDKKLSAGSLIGFDFGNLESRFVRTENLGYPTYIPGVQDTFQRNIRHIANYSFSSFYLTPYVRYDPFKFMFVRLGLKVGFVLSAKRSHTEELIDNQILLPDGRGGTITLDSNTAETGKFSNYNSLQLSLNPAIGFNIPLSRKTTLSPIFSYTLPLNNFTDEGQNFKISSWMLIFELKFARRDDELVDPKKR